MAVRPGSLCSSAILTTALTLATAVPLFAQSPEPHPWSGVAVRESEPWERGWSWGNSKTWRDAISGDGSLVVFESDASNIVIGDTNGVTDVFVRDRRTRGTVRVSVASDSTQANGPSGFASISNDGRHVVFRSCASNLVPDDNNGVCDVFVHDVESGATTLASVGPAGEPTVNDSNFFASVSTNGRYVAFIGAFSYQPWGGPSLQAWVRDRDADGNGIYDEPGMSTTTQVTASSDGIVSSLAISGNGRIVAFSRALPEGGDAMFVHSLEWNATWRIDFPLGEPNPYVGYSSYWPDLSEDGQFLAYVSNRPYVVPEDGNEQLDVFVTNVFTGGSVRLPADVPGLPAFDEVYAPSISADGGLVTFQAVTLLPDAVSTRVFVWERVTNAAYEIGRAADGSLDPYGVGFHSISADGSAIVFDGGPGVMHDGGQAGVFVATDISLSYPELKVPLEGGSYVVQLHAPENTAWEVSGQFAGVSIEPRYGKGSAAIQFTVSDNSTTGEPHDFLIYVGSEAVRITQPALPNVSYVSPFSGPVSGGTEVDVFGNGFSPGVTVVFGNVEATIVEIVSPTHIRAITPPQPRGELVLVKAFNPDGSTGGLTGDFSYEDNTPPVVEATIAGTLASDGWYTSDVTVTWAVSDPESVIVSDPCAPVTVNFDATGYHVACVAESLGGWTFEWVDIKRDATPPWVVMQVPANDAVYTRGDQIAAQYTCLDTTSGVAECAGPVPGLTPLDTSTAGRFTFTVSARDAAGNESTATASYSVLAPTTLTAIAETVQYGQRTPITARLMSDGAPVAGRRLTFHAGGYTAIATTGSDGIAAAGFWLDAGTYALSVQFEGDGQYADASGAANFLVARATAAITWANPAGVTYGIALSAAQLNASANVVGTFSYSPAAGTVLPAGTHTLDVTFTPSDSANYDEATASVSIMVAEAPSTIAWASPTGIVYGAALGVSELNATANVPGSFSYSPSAGTVLGAGTHTLNVTFTPDDAANYTGGAATVNVTVAPAPLTIRANNASKVYGEALPAFTATGTGFVNGDMLASLAGTLTFATSATASSAPGSYGVTPDGVTSANYDVTFAAGSLTIAKAATTTTLATNPNSSMNNKTVQLTATVAAVAPGSGTATGAIEFRENGTLLGTAPLVNGVATLSASFRKGAHPLTATYAGDTNFTGSSGVRTHYVN